MTPEEVINKQLEAYNRGDIEGFAAFYADDARVEDADGKPRCVGKNQLREVYGAMFKANPHQMCIVVSRIKAGEFVIDDEEILGRADKQRRLAVVIYRIKGDHIRHVTILAK